MGTILIVKFVSQTLVVGLFNLVAFFAFVGFLDRSLVRYRVSRVKFSVILSQWMKQSINTTSVFLSRSIFYLVQQQYSGAIGRIDQVLMGSQPPLYSPRL